MTGRLAEPAACIDEALLLYRGSSSGWENASDYFYASPAPPTNAREVVDPGIKLHAVQPLPPAFTAQFHNVQYKSFMGLFPQICRAWLTVDSNLFLWSYALPEPSAPAAVRNPTLGPDLYVYEGISQIIVSVALVPPRVGVFVDSIKYLLAVATSVDVTLLGVAFSPTGEVSLVPTNISVATDGVLMLKLHATPDGRIFMAGADGSLHEFTYDARPHAGLLDLLSGRPAKRARKLVHTPSSLAQYLIPSSLKAIFTKDDELVDLAIDPTRAALYTLSQAGSLAVYDISESATTRFVCSVNVAHESRHMVSFSVPAKEREYVSIHSVVGLSASSVHLIVVTSFGERIYFSTLSGSMLPLSSSSSVLDTTSRSSRRNVRPKTLSCVGYRPSPDRLISRSSRPCIHIAWCEKGAAVFADLRENESDRLISVYPDANLGSVSLNLPDARPGASRTAEVVFETSLGGSDGSSYEAFNGTPLGTTTAGSRGTGYGVNASMHYAPKRTFAIAEAYSDGFSDQGPSDDAPIDAPGFFWVLTSTAMHLYERVQPIDRLKEVLASGGGATSDIQAFFSRHGAAETCAMCLEIAITQPSLLSAAANVFYTYGGDPQFDRRQTPPETQPRPRHEAENRRRSVFAQLPPGGGRSGRLARSSFDIGRPSLQSAPLSRFSGAHDGASLYLAKTLHPLWNKYVTTNRDPEGYQTLAASKELIGTVRDQLLAIVSFLESYTPEAMLPAASKDDSHQAGHANGHDSRRPQAAAEPNRATRFGDERNRASQDPMFRGLYQLQQTSEARRVESSSIIALKNLSIRTVEALALLLVLSDHQLHRLAVSMSRESRIRLASMRLCDLVADEGNSVSSSLIEAVFASYADGASAVMRVGRILQDRCSSYFGDSDVDLHRGLAILRQAVECMSGFAEDRQGGMAVMGREYDSPGGWVARNSGGEAALIAAQNLAEEAVRILKSVPDRIYDIDAVCQDLRAIRAVPSLVDLSLTVGRVAEAAGKQDRANAAYDAILDALRPLVHGADVSSTIRSDAEEDGTSEYSERLRDAGMRVAFSSESEGFLRKLYEFLLESKQGEEILLQHSAPSLEKFLEEKHALDLLWRYCARHGRYLEAAGVLLNLAESEGDQKLVDRLNYLSCALHNAKTAASKGDSRAPSLLSEISDFMDVAKVQLRVREELLHRHARGPEVDQALEELDGAVLGLSTLFNKYARPFKLYEASLEAFRCGAYRDDAYVRGLWSEIVEREAAVAKTPALLRQKMQALGREFYPSDVAFPTGYIIDLLERLVYRNGSAVIWKDAADWVSNTMKAVGVPLSDLVDGYRRMIENPQQATSGDAPWSWTEENAQLHLLKATERVISMWTAECAGSERQKVPSYDQGRRTLLSDCDKALRAITLCKSRLRGMSSVACAALVQRFEALERRISPLIQ